jgi:hypothetical protein
VSGRTEAGEAALWKEREERDGYMRVVRVRVRVSSESASDSQSAAK